MQSDLDVSIDPEHVVCCKPYTLFFHSNKNDDSVQQEWEECTTRF